MDPVTEAAVELKVYEDLAKRIDHALLRPDFTDEDVAAGLRAAVDGGMGCATVRPSDLDFAVRMLSGTPVAPGSTAGYPEGGQTTGVKLYEARDLIRRGVREIETVPNLGKLLSRQFQHIETELLQMGRSCLEAGVTLKVIVDHPSLTEDLKVIAMKICKRCEVTYVSLAASDLALGKRILKDVCRMKVSSGVSTLDAALAACAAGADRLNLENATAILADWRERLAAQPDPGAGTPSI
ncbi:hypothetical protein [uncultured Paludibaculum sp.]|uniref:hypothetical protein n=1 Tax=uncultured Paludibaculum sp. TaxID=1765020 RepID=UPI002AAB1912|nr:hypothetical protein [uncultured Paludibaculum sp.]